MTQYVSLRQLHPIACQVVDQWREDNAVLAITVVSPDHADYNAQPGDYISTDVDGAVAIDVYALAAKQCDRVPDHVHYPGDRVLVITGRDILPLDYVDYHCYCAAIVRDAYVLGVIDLSVTQSSTQEAQP
jgi:hypothetical protein